MTNKKRFFCMVLTVLSIFLCLYFNNINAYAEDVTNTAITLPDGYFSHGEPTTQILANSQKYAYMYQCYLGGYNNYPIYIVITTNNVTITNRKIKTNANIMTVKRLSYEVTNQINQYKNNRALFRLLSHTRLNTSAENYYYGHIEGSDDIQAHIFIPQNLIEKFISANKMNVESMPIIPTQTLNSFDNANNTDYKTFNEYMDKVHRTFDNSISVSYPSELYNSDSNNPQMTNSANAAGKFADTISRDISGYKEQATFNIQGTCCGITTNLNLSFNASTALESEIRTNCTDVQTSRVYARIMTTKNFVDYSYTKKLMRNKNNHRGDYETTNTFTSCDKASTITTKCKGCGVVTKVQNVVAKAHTWDTGIVTTQPTCVTTGVKTYTCSVCKNKKTEIISKLGHASDNKYVVKTQATCTMAGVEVQHCTRCNTELNSRAINPLGHNPIVSTTNPTCTKDGKNTTKCSRCNIVLDEEPIPKLGHTSDDKYVVKTAPTCETKGEETTHCIRCKIEMKSREIDALGHDYEDKITLEPTCSQNGIELHTCTRCNSQNTTLLDKIPHTWDDGVVTKQPTTTTTGIKTYTCLVCKTTKNETIPKISKQDNDDKNDNNDSNDKQDKDKDQNTNNDKQNNNDKKNDNYDEDKASTSDKELSPTKVATVVFDKNGEINGSNTYQFKQDGITYIVTLKKDGSILAYYYNVQLSKWVAIPNSTQNNNSYFYTRKKNKDGTTNIVIKKSTTQTNKIKKVTIKNVKSNKKKNLTITFKKLSKVNGYQIQVSTNAKFTKKTTKSKTLSSSKIKWTFKQLKSKKKYYVRVRAFKTQNGKKVYGNWSKTKKIKVK